ncbi:MAG: sulfatase [Verrucomicrobia bacterium]|nr:MAG: sulfatase [Verrucomicrobiota bacterium]
MATIKYILSFVVLCVNGWAAAPNVVIILSDDHSWTDYGFMGHEIVQTPNLDKLAESGVLFERAYVPTALCRPSLMTLATGRYASDHKISGNDPISPNRVDRLSMIGRIQEMDTLAKLLGEQGYLSHQSGKWWEGHYSNGGFTHGMTQGFPNKGGRHGDAGLDIGRQGMEPVTDFIDMAVEQEKPFFVWYAPFLPHTPHTPPERLLNKYKDKVDSIHVARYYAMVEWFDETCGELLDHLEEKKVRENTLVIYFGDNGWIQDPDSDKFAFGSKQMPHDGGVRQPTIYSWPDRIAPRRRQDLVSSIDILPTICAATGARLPAGLPGLSLLKAMEQNEPVERDRIFGESFAHDVVDLDDPEKTLLYRWVIEGRYKLILTYSGKYGHDEGANVGYAERVHNKMDKRPQLYDLQDDPRETNNLAGENPELTAQLVAELDQWYRVTKRTCLKIFNSEVVDGKSRIIP